MSRSRIATISRVSALDRISKVVKSLGAPIAGESAPAKLKDALNGVWLGHPLHPLVVALPIGAWTAAAAFDFAGDDRAADGAVLIGIAGGLAAAATGVTQYYDATTNERPRRLGALHAVLNASGLSCYVISAALRCARQRTAAQWFSMAGLGFVAGGGLVGGDLVYTLGIGVDRTVFERRLTKWTDTVPEAEIPEGKPMRIEVKGAPVLIVRQDGKVYATSATCSHLGGPLNEGEYDQQTCVVTCPWHGSEFDVRNGKVVHSPATEELQSYDIQVEEGRIKIRSR